MNHLNKVPVIDALRSLRRHIPTLTRSGWVGIALPIVVFLSFLLTIGPTIQYYAFSITDNSSPIDYRDLHQAAPSDFMPLAKWLLSAFNWYSVAVAAASTLYALRGDTLKIFATRLAISVASILTATDFIFGIANLNADLLFYISNLAANIAGGLLSAILTSAIFIMSHSIRNFFYTSKYNVIIFPSVAVLSGILLSSASYAVVVALYQQLPANVTLISTPPFRGFYAADPMRDKNKDNTDPNPPRRPFDLLPNKDITSKFVMQSSMGELLAHWKRSDDANVYNFELRLFADCPGVQLDKLPASPSIINLPNVTSIYAGFDEGDARFSYRHEIKSHFDYQSRKGTFYWISKDDKANSINIAQFMLPEDTSTITTSGKLSFSINASMLKESGSATVTSPRTFSWKVDDQKHSYRFSRKTAWNGDAKLTCRALDIPNDNSNTGPSVRAVTDLPGLQILAVITLTPQRPSTLIYRDSDESIVLTGATGTSWVYSVPPHDLDGTSDGYMQFLSVHGNVKELRLDDRLIDVSQSDAVTMMGDFSADYDADGRLLVKGTANKIWKGSHKINITRWELVKEFHLWIIGGLITALLAAGGYLWVRFGALADEPLSSWST